MNRYTLFKETAEISESSFKKYDGDIINALFEKDRSSAEPIKNFDSKEEANAELQKYRCTYYRTSGYANVFFYACEFYYIEEEEYNEEYDEWEINNEYSDYAEIKKPIRKIVLTEDAHAEGYDGAFYRFTNEDGKPSTCGIHDFWYEAHAEDAEGNDYCVVWEISDMAAFVIGDEDCCKWNEPAEIYSYKDSKPVEAEIEW